MAIGKFDTGKFDEDVFDLAEMNDLTTKLLILFEAQFTTTFKFYNYGMVRVPGQSSMPAIYATPIRTEVLNSGLIRDKNNFTIKVVIMDSLKRYLDNISGSGDIIQAMQQLVKWVENRNSDGSVEDASIIGIIRQNITTSGAVLFNNEIIVNYEDFLEANEMPIVKATLTFTAQSRSNRL